MPATCRDSQVGGSGCVPCCLSPRSCICALLTLTPCLLTASFLARWTLLPTRSYEDPEIALQCGQMFRDCIRHEPVARLVLESHIFTDMFGKLELSNFEVASGGLSESRGRGKGRHREVPLQAN